MEHDSKNDAKITIGLVDREELGLADVGFEINDFSFEFLDKITGGHAKRFRRNDLGA